MIRIANKLSALKTANVDYMFELLFRDIFYGRKRDLIGFMVMTWRSGMLM
jgi:hypothetical protein